MIELSEDDWAVLSVLPGPRVPWFAGAVTAAIRAWNRSDLEAQGKAEVSLARLEKAGYVESKRKRDFGVCYRRTEEGTARVAAHSTSKVN